MPTCPLCLSSRTCLFHAGQGREFHRCDTCDLVFVPSPFHLDAQAEMERYLQHNNDPEDEAYRAFLSRLLDPLRPHLRPSARGLDYGAGPGPALVAMMREEGFEVSVFDLYFSPDESPLAESYDFITCTETAEHFAEPGREFQRLHAMLRPSGWLGVMTSMLDDWSRFPGWHYQRDPTHISFYSKRTMCWIGRRHALDVHFPAPNVTLFHKPLGATHASEDVG